MTNSPQHRVPAQRFDLQYQGLREAVAEALEKVCASGHFILGPEVERFENEFAAWTGSAHAVGCASGTDALYLSLLALGIGAGDEVITTSHSFFATAGAIVHAGAKPVFVDIDPQTYNMDPALIEAKITAKTRAILPVHLYGYPCNMDKIMDLAHARRLPVIEDCAQSHGASVHEKKTGTFGITGCFSFYPTKNLGAYGDAGLITTTDEKLDKDLRIWRGQGVTKRYYHEKLGINSRLDAMQAAVLRIKLRHLDEQLRLRREKAAYYGKLFQAHKLEQVVLPREARDYHHVYHQYVIRVPRRDALLEFLLQQGIDVFIYYPIPLHLTPALKFMGGKSGDFPRAEAAAAETLALPMYPELTDQDQEYVVTKIKEFLG